MNRNSSHRAKEKKRRTLYSAYSFSLYEPILLALIRHHCLSQSNVHPQNTKWKEHSK